MCCGYGFGLVSVRIVVGVIIFFDVLLVGVIGFVGVSSETVIECNTSVWLHLYFTTDVVVVVECDVDNDVGVAGEAREIWQFFGELDTVDAEGYGIGLFGFAIGYIGAFEEVERLPL